MTLLELQDEVAAERCIRDGASCPYDLMSAAEEERDAASVAADAAALCGVVRLHELCFDGSSLHVIVDHCAGGDLFDHITRRRRLEESEAAQLFAQLCSTVRALHRRGVVHRDLKPENILLLHPTRSSGSSGGSGAVGSRAGRYSQLQAGRVTDGCAVRLVDFGLAVCLQEGQLAQGIVGSPYYIAPEVIQGLPHGAPVDVWSLGVLLYVCLTGRLPFFGRDNTAIFSSVLEGRPDMDCPPWPSLSVEVRHLVLRMLSPAPHTRIAMEEVVTHPWLQHWVEMLAGGAGAGARERERGRGRERVHLSVSRSLRWSSFPHWSPHSPAASIGSSPSAGSRAVEGHAAKGSGRREEEEEGAAPGAGSVAAGAAAVVSGSQSSSCLAVPSLHAMMMGGAMMMSAAPALSLPSSALASASSGSIRV